MSRRLGPLRSTTVRTALAASVATVCAVSTLSPAAACAQSITTEAAVTAGASTDSLAAGALQLRGFGDVPGAVRFFGEVSLAQTANPDNDGLAGA